MVDFLRWEPLIYTSVNFFNFSKKCLASLSVPFSQPRHLPVSSRRHQSSQGKTKALFTRDILTHNIAIKRYFWAIDFYWPSLNEPQIKVLHVSLRAYLGWVWKPIAQNFFYCNIFLSQYCVPKCLVWKRPEKIKRYCDKKIILSHGFQWLAKVST